MKIVIIGYSGSGKSTLAKTLGDYYNIPVLHLDSVHFKPGWVERDDLESNEIVKEFMSKNDSWIIDGNYGGSMEMRIKECDTVFFLDYPTEVCIDGVELRKGKPRSDMPWFEKDNIDDDFISFINNYNSESRPKVIGLLKKYSSKEIIVFHSRAESEEYLSSLKKNCI